MDAVTTDSKEAAVAYLEITLQIDPQDRAAAAAVYSKYKAPVLSDVAGAKSKDLLVRDEDVQVLHGFDSVAHANAYLASDLFTGDVVGELGPLLKATPTSASSTWPSAGLSDLNNAGPHHPTRRTT